MDDIKKLDLDRALGFAIPSRSARGRIVRLGPVLDRVLSAHAYPPAIERLLAEALTLAALMGSTLKDPSGQMTMQAQTQDGVVSLLVCDYKGGELRGYAQFDEGRLTELPAEPSLRELFGDGYLAITFDLAVTKERYQGIVPIDGASLSEAAQHFFVQSEQIPSFVRVGIDKRGDGTTVAGGLFLQHLPEGELGRERLHVRLDHPEWEHVAALGNTMHADELADPTVPLETLVWRLFHEEEGVRTLQSTDLSRGCRCTPEHIRGVIAKFPLEERREMAGADGMITVDCRFCATKFAMEVGEEIA